MENPPPFRPTPANSGSIGRLSAWFGMLVGCLLLSACEPSFPTDSPGQRIVSLDYCADQFVLGLADRANILALSPDAAASFSYMRDAAEGLPVVRPRAEDVLALKPSLVVRSYGGGPNARGFFERAGVAVAQIRFADNIAAVREVIRHAARALGAPERGEALITGMDARLRAARGRRPDTRALYMTPAGYSAGPGTLVDDAVTAAGLGNFQTRRGWHPIPLEDLAYETPDMVARADFGEGTNHDDAWTPFRHPVAQRAMRTVPVAAVDGATTACGGWFVADAVTALATLRHTISAKVDGNRGPAEGRVKRPDASPPTRGLPAPEGAGKRAAR